MSRTLTPSKGSVELAFDREHDETENSLRRPACRPTRIGARPLKKTAEARQGNGFMLEDTDEDWSSSSSSREEKAVVVLSVEFQGRQWIASRFI